jgi:hypothetical protein
MVDGYATVYADLACKLDAARRPHRQLWREVFETIRSASAALAERPVLTTAGSH